MKIHGKAEQNASQAIIQEVLAQNVRIRRQSRPHPAGFTLIELVVTLLIVGILTAIAAPSWLSLQANQTLRVGQDEALQAFRQTQSQAIRTRQDWLVSFRTKDGIVQWEMHPTANASIAPNWQNFISNVQIDPAETTLSQTSGVYQMQFDLRGNVYPPLGRITFSHKTGGQARRCIVISTVLGAMRKGQNQRTADQSGRFCY
ncbi:MAG TPA: type II secretion system protein [Trichocoleus sp.]|jgi:prepilin-type N-terminal cleavage/methylation domain-containing protein